MRLTLVTLLIMTPLPVLAQHWEVNGVEETFGDANAACRAALKDAPGLEFAPPARKPDGEERPDRIFRECWARAKGGSNADGGNPASMYTLAWFSPARDDEPKQGDDDEKDGAAKKPSGCHAGTDFGWFPSLEKSRFKAAGAEVVADTKPGSCPSRSQSAGGRLFTGSDQKIRADRMKKRRKPVGEHYFLTYQGLIIDPTFFQFFLVGDHPGLVFVGTKEQLVETADKLLAQCGANPASTDSKSGAEFYAAHFDDANLCNAGSTLVISKSGRGEYQNSDCDRPPAK